MNLFRVELVILSNQSFFYPLICLHNLLIIKKEKFYSVFFLFLIKFKKKQIVFEKQRKKYKGKKFLVIFLPIFFFNWIKKFYFQNFYLLYPLLNNCNYKHVSQNF
jgi:hypothetical protein